jgi:hypothetical protein
VRRFASTWLALAVGITVPGFASAQESPAKSEHETTPEWSARLSGESGVGMRRFELPMDGVVYHTDAGVFPVAGVALEIEHAASASVSIGLLGRYQTSVGLDIIELHTDGSRVPIEVRAHRFEGGLTPTFHFDEERLWALALCAGYGLLGFRPLLHLVTPAYTLSGPFVRAQLQLPVFTDVLRLRAGPEAQWIVQVGDELKERGMDAMGVALGGEAALDLAIGHHLTVHASYREAWSMIASSQDRSFKDIARFATAGVTWMP